MADWNAAQYARFIKERTQPSLDLIGRIVGLRPVRVLDIGCGPGNSTAALKCAFPDAQILGIDSSDDMLARAREANPDLEFAHCRVPDDFGSLPDDYNLIFSNACLQWIPDHERLLAAIFGKMAHGATLAVQIPLTQRAPFHKIVHELVGEPQWSATLGSIHNFYTLEPEEYYDLLSDLAADFTIWETTYYHRVDSVEQVLEWYRGSGLRPYLSALEGDAKRATFQKELLAKMERTYNVQRDGTVILKMPRLFFTATAR